jgi:hypothetical protein
MTLWRVIDCDAVTGVTKSLTFPTSLHRCERYPNDAQQPTFIKIGQQFSTRVDVLAPEFVKELEKLQVRGVVLWYTALLLTCDAWRSPGVLSVCRMQQLHRGKPYLVGTSRS